MSCQRCRKQTVIYSSIAAATAHAGKLNKRVADGKFFPARFACGHIHLMRALGIPPRGTP